MEELKALPTLISSALEREVGEGGDCHGDSRLIIARVSLVGRTEFSTQIIREKGEMASQLEFKVGNSEIIIDRIDNNTRGRIDLIDLAKGNNSVAILAQVLLKLEEGKEKEIPKELINQIKGGLMEVYNSKTYSALRREDRIAPPGDKEVFELLRREGQHLLDTLLAQKGE